MMKNETKVSDFKALIAMEKSKFVYENSRPRAQQCFDRACLNYTDFNKQQLEDSIKLQKLEHTSYLNNHEKWLKIPKARRDLAIQTKKEAIELGNRIARLGSYYSGELSYRVDFIPGRAIAQTCVKHGVRYSRKCKYHKTNASHEVYFDIETVPFLMEQNNVRELSRNDGLPLISLKPNGEATWVITRGKQIAHQTGWIVWNATMCYHSTKSYGDAEQGLVKKIKAFQKQLVQQKAERKQQRRARLIAKLCKNVKATVDDALKMGYCLPGIQAFQRQYNIADESPLFELVNTNNPQAINLALNVARKVRKHV